MTSSFEKLKAALMELEFETEQEPTQEDSIDIEAYSIEEALEKAAEHFGVAISDLEYDILEQGKRTLFFKKPYKLRIKIVDSVKRIKEELGEREIEQKIIKRDVNGSFKIKVTRVGVMLKVTPPRGKGRKVRVEEVLDAISRKGVVDFEKSRVARAILEAKDEYVKISDYIPDERLSGRVVVEVSEDEMKAFMTLIPPKPGGRDIDIDDVMEALEGKGVVEGIKEDVIQHTLEDEIYNMPVLVAEGSKPVHGEDAKVVYHFRTEKKIQLEEDEKGKVDYRDLDLVENVVAGQILATKVKATEGKPGKTVTGRILEAKPGNDIELQPGKNTELSPDGISIIATINGQAILSGGKVHVEPIYEVKGDVDMRTGNILFLGTVIVKGNVEDGFSIKASGDIEVIGSVGKCILDAEGNINIKQGVMGKLGGIIKAGGNIWSKFLEQTNVEAGKNVFVQDGIMHCQVDATEKVICYGRRATIVGGRIRAGELVNTKTLGSVSFTETIVEVGFDPKTRQRLFDLEKEKTELEDEVEKLSANINTLQNQKKTGRGFTEEKQEMLERFLAKREDLTIRSDEIKEEMEELKSYLKLLKTLGKVSVSKEVFPGVRIGIKDVYYDVSNEFKHVTFVLENNRIRIKKYEEIDLEEIVGRKIR